MKIKKSYFNMVTRQNPIDVPLSTLLHHFEHDPLVDLVEYEASTRGQAPPVSARI